jgi:Protein of unknown function (DUF2750)
MMLIWFMGGIRRAVAPRVLCEAAGSGQAAERAHRAIVPSLDDMQRLIRQEIPAKPCHRPTSGMKMNDKQLAAVFALPGPKRYSHFIKAAADQRRVWGLFDDGWALVGTEDGAEAFPLWPAKEYAAAYGAGEWEGYSPREIDLDSLLGILLPKLRESGTLVAVFPTPSNKGVIPSIDLLEENLRTELSRIE